MDPSVLLNLEKLRKLLDSKKDVISQQMTINAPAPKHSAFGPLRPTYETITTDISGTRILSHTQNNHHVPSQHHQPSSLPLGLPIPNAFVHPPQQINQMTSQIPHYDSNQLGQQHALDLPTNISQASDPNISNSSQSILSQKIAKMNENREVVKRPKIKKSEKEQILKEKKKKVKTMRKAGGEIWQDLSLEDWPESDYRLFCGNIGNEVTDEVLANAFRKYHSFQRARVVRDKKTGKTKGYGFVSLMDSQDFLRAIKEMDRKYVGNRPIKLSKSNWRDRSISNNKTEIETHVMKKKKKK